MSYLLAIQSSGGLYSSLLCDRRRSSLHALDSVRCVSHPDFDFSTLLIQPDLLSHLQSVPLTASVV
jgi:hypothetical protein